MGDKNSIQLKRCYNQKKALVEAGLKGIVAEIEGEDAENYNKALSHTLLAGGKRIRPVLAIAVFELFSDDTERVLGPACALELIHVGSLMLDDLPSMDDAELRRGKTTSHLLFGESTAILASAALWMKAFEIIASTDHPSIGLLVRKTADLIGSKGVVLGQFYDLEATKRSFSLDDLEKHYILKTSSMFRLATKYGAVLGGANNEQLENFDKFAVHLGLAFQIRDDILDVTKSKEQTGKDSHKDDVNHKLNYVSLVGVDESKAAFYRHLLESKKYLKATGLDSRFILSIAEKLETI